MKDKNLIKLQIIFALLSIVAIIGTIAWFTVHGTDILDAQTKLKVNTKNYTFFMNETGLTYNNTFYSYDNIFHYIEG